MTYLDFEKVSEMSGKKVGNYKLGRFTYNGKSKTLTDENGCVICDHVGYFDDIERIIIDEFEPIIFYISESIDGGFRSSVITPHRDKIRGTIVKLYSVVARCPSEVLEKKAEWKEIKLDGWSFDLFLLLISILEEQK